MTDLKSKFLAACSLPFVGSHTPEAEAENARLLPLLKLAAEVIAAAEEASKFSHQSYREELEETLARLEKGLSDE